MRVTNQHLNKSSIYNLGKGTVFRYGSDYYIKTDKYNYANRTYTCVRLVDGTLTQIDDSIIVEYYDAEVVIK